MKKHARDGSKSMKMMQREFQEIIGHWVVENEARLGGRDNDEMTVHNITVDQAPDKMMMSMQVLCKMYYCCIGNEYFGLTLSLQQLLLLLCDHGRF